MGDTHITLSNDQREVVSRHVRDGIQTLVLLAELLKKDMELDSDLAKTAVSNVEHKLANISRTLGLKSESEQEVENRYAEMRRLNLRIRELEGKIGTEAGPDAVSQGIKSLVSGFRKWWKVEGLGHVAGLHLTESGFLCAKLSCHLFGRAGSTMSSTPVSDRERHKLWIAELEAQGYELIFEERGREPQILDSDRSRETVANLVRTRFPSAAVVGTTNHRVYGQQQLALKDVDIIIYRLDELQGLQDIVADGEEY
jgi:hypothetical protein